MKTTKKLTLFGTGILFSAALLFSFTQKEINDLNHEDGTYITMMTTEVHGKNAKGSEIEICFASDKIEHVPLKEYASENRDANLITITKSLNDLRKRGYKLVSSSVAVTQFHKTELFIFEKK